MPADTAENIKGDAEARRNLTGNNLFCNLGEPIQNILIEVSSNGKEVEDKTLELLSHITVKQLAKIWEMLGQGEDPETILAWLKRRARKNKGNDDSSAKDRKAMIKTGAERDPIAFFKALEAANEEKAKEFEEMNEERAQLRLAKAGEREKARKEKQKALEEAKKAVEDEGGWWKATDHVPVADKKAIAAGFEKFAAKESEFDNTDKDQDGEWWKRDPFRRDWERNKGKGKKWTGVVEGSPERAIEDELAVREEFYRGNDWWKADKYKRDWDATKEAEWWKEEPYIKDWQNNKQDGDRWLAADEESGLEGEGDKYPATPEEQKRREDWYRANGPRGVVKAWNGATEGDMEKCSVPEKEAREEFYRNGDWWKNDDARQDFMEKGLDADALLSAKPQTDSEWWKGEPFREDYWKNGPGGKKWPAITEAAGIDGIADQKPAPEPEKKRREDWYKDNWWKQPQYKADWKKKGKVWKAPTEKEAKTGEVKKPVGATEAKMRDDWYRNGDEEWWKSPQYVEDYFQKGDEGRHWPGKTEQDGTGGKGQENPAAPDEKARREKWYKDNWWKQPKYIDDFHKNGDLGDAWQSKKDDPNKDKEWWKQPVFIENWSKTMAPKTKPEASEWWKQPQYVEDFNVKGPQGTKWTAAKEGAAVAGTGDKTPAPEAEKAKREAWYKDNWWRAPRYAMDWARQGNRGQEWRAGSKPAADDNKRGASKEPCTPAQAKEREEFYRPVGDMWRAVAEEPAFEAKAAELPCTKADAVKRDEWYRTNWWKAPEFVDDWTKNGSKGMKWPAACEAAGKAGQAWEEPCTDEEKAKRDEWYRNAGDNEWWKEPQYCEDWAHNGPDGARWTADTRPHANKNGGKEHPAEDPEKAAREQWYKDNWWKTPAAFDDWKKHGKDGPTCGRAKPLDLDRRDPETIGDGWWKKPEFIDDWLGNGGDGKHWTANDPAAGAAGQGHKKPASDPEKAAREKWYKDNWWKAPSCADDWAKKGANGDRWGAATPEASEAGQAQAQPADDAEKAKREDWYRKHGDPDWWKKPEFIADHADNGSKGKMWTAGNPTAGALGVGDECPASGPEKAKREKWYGDNWWKQPKHIQDWKKGPQGTGSWKRDATPEQEQDRDAWYRANQGDPATEPEKDDRDAWFRKHGKDDDKDDLAAREEWYKKQLGDDEKARRMEWLRDRPGQEKRILESELPEALAAINEGQAPTDKQLKAVMNALEWNRKAEKDDFDDGSGRKRGVADDEDEPTITQTDFEAAVAAANFYVAPDADEKEMEEEEALHNQENDVRTREVEEAAYLAMTAEEEEAAKTEDWQRLYKDPEDDDWWKKPQYIEEFQENPNDEDGMWRRDEEGGDDPADAAEQQRREDWMKENWWKSPKFSQEWRQNQDDPEGAGYRKRGKPDDEDDDGMGRDDDASDADDGEIEKREAWYRKAAQMPSVEPEKDTWESKRAKPVEETPKEETWTTKKAPEGPPPAKQVWASTRPKEPEAEPTPETWQSKRPPPPPVAKADTWVSKKREPEPVPKAEPLPPPPPPEEPFHGEKIREEDFPFHGEKLREEDFEVFAEEVAEFFGEKIREEDFVEKFDEEIAEFFGEKLREDDFVAEKFDEEIAEFFGEKLREEDFVDKVDEEVAEFFGEKLREEDFVEEAAPVVVTKNEDDMSEGDFEDPDEDMEEEEARVEEEEEAAPEEEEEEEDDDPWDDEVDEEVEEEESEEGSDNEHQEDSDLEDELEAALEEQEQEWEEDEEDDDDEDEHEADQDDEDGSEEEQDDDPEKAPEPWMLPLPEVTNNIYLKSYFPVLKFHPGKKSAAVDRRVWVVDHFAKSFYCLDANGKLKKQHDANKLLQLERNIMDPRRARLMFFDAPKSYEVIFPSTEERERFYETGSSIRPAIRVYAPSLTKPDTAHDGGSTTTTIDGVKENAVTQHVPNPFKKTGEMVDRELSGRCKINSSKVQDEPFTLWCGTFDMCGTQPPRDSSSLEAFMPKGKYDVYALGAQDVSYQTEEGQWFQYVQEYMGKDYLVLASMQVWDITIIVLCKKKCLLKITNVEGSTKATLHKEKCGMKGAAGICMKFHNTSLAFISVQLASRVERTKMRRINVEEIVNQIQLANKDSDLSSQFHHVFFMGNMNYRIEMESAEAQELIASKDYQELLSHDQLLTAMREDGLLHGFVEAPITFPPTYRYKVGSSDYMMDRGRAPSYTDRILVKSTENSDLKVTGYGSVESVMTSEHKPVYATYTIRALRPHASCFHRDQEPRPQLNISSVTFTEQNHMLFRKPEIRAYSPFSEHAHRGKAFKAETMLPEFAGENLFEPIKIVVQMTEYLERNHITLIFRDTAEAREDKMFRGAAVMELKDCVEPYDQERSVDLDVICMSRKVGTVKVNYKVTNYGYTPPPGGAPGRVPEAALMDKDAGDAEEEE